MNKNTRKSLRRLGRVAVVGILLGLLLGSCLGDGKVGGTVGGLVAVSLFLLQGIEFSRPVEVLTPHPERGPRVRTKVDRAIEPFLSAVIGAAYGGTYYILGGKDLSACLVNGAVIFFLIDFVYLHFVAPNK